MPSRGGVGSGRRRFCWGQVRDSAGTSLGGVRSLSAPGFCRLRAMDFQSLRNPLSFLPHRMVLVGLGDIVARLTSAQKAERVLRFLLGTRHPAACAALTARGFGEKDLDEGWGLLRRVSKWRFDLSPSVQCAEPSAMKELDRWENSWFPVISASLRRRFPEVAERLFFNAPQSHGVTVIVSVSILMSRLRDLQSATDPQSRGAWALLRQRGLSDEVLAEAQTLLNRAKYFWEEVGGESDLDRKAQEQAESELWGWYLEWSRIARTVIGDRGVLRALGLLTPTRGAGKEEHSSP